MVPKHGVQGLRVMARPYLIVASKRTPKVLEASYMVSVVDNNFNIGI